MNDLFNHLSLFSGIGGFDLASEWMGWNNVAHCEWNSFCQRVLKYHFPNSIQHHDITKTDFSVYRGTIDIVTGGFPCQPFSTAGKQKGTNDERYLWPEMFRAIREIQSPFIVGENVPGLINWSRGMVFEQVQSDLETEGYEIIPFILPAASVKAPHERGRIWFIAYSERNGQQRSKVLKEINNNRISERMAKGHEFNPLHDNGFITDTHSAGLQERISRGICGIHQSIKPCQGGEFTRVFAAPDGWEKFPTQSPICIGDDGISGKLDGITFSEWRIESIKAGGNAIVPQLALKIFKSIKEFSISQK